MTAAPAQAPETGAAFLARVNPNRRIVRTGLVLDAEALDEWTQVQNEIVEQKIKDAQSPRLATGGGTAKPSAAVTRLEKKRDKLEDDLAEKQAWFVLRAMPSPDYQALKDTHPPRPDNQLDQLHGYNRDAVSDAAVHECLVDPVFSDCDKRGCTHNPDKDDACGSFQMLQVILAPTEWQELRDAAMEANGAVKDAPKSRRESSRPSRLARGSERQPAGE